MLIISKKKAVLVITVAVLLLVISQTRWFNRMLYPIDYRENIFKYANEYNIDPYLIAAIIKTESNFKPQAESSQGAVGMMQIMPETGAWVSSQINISNYSENKLNDPDTNIKIGTWYISSLKKEFNNDMILALASYNGGRGNVKEWLDKKQWTGEHATIEQIPFPETRKYVEKVLENYKKYRWIYLGT